MLPTSVGLKLAVKRLKACGFEVEVDEAALAKLQRFGGSDEQRPRRKSTVWLHARPAWPLASPLACYGLTRLLDAIDWPLLAQSVERGTRWVGYSDLTALQMGMLATP
ncbi:MAG: LD-carboxypeptidase [Ideonella sp.]|nr:LD-carboxypeptidase [Ideonella sp.]